MTPPPAIRRRPLQKTRTVKVRLAHDLHDELARIAQRHDVSIEALASQIVVSNIIERRRPR